MSEDRHCDVCYHYDWNSRQCTTWDCEFVLNAEVQRCRFTTYCKKPSCSHKDSWECPIADKIMDHLMEARDMEREFQDEDEIPFCEDYDGPEVEE